MEKTNRQLAEELLASGDFRNLDHIRLLFDLARLDTDVELVKKARKYAENLSREGNLAAYQLVEDIYHYLAPMDFDAYLVYLEWNRRPEAKFYLPRRRQLQSMVGHLQDIVDDKLDELFISCPPRVGKTSLLVFFTTWVLGRDGEATNLYCAYSDVITSAFYNAVLEIITDVETYRWHDVFPACVLKKTNAQLETIDINRTKHYPSLTCRSLYGTLNGACDVKNLLIADDLIGGIEEALNPDRLTSAWSKVENNMIPRAVGERKKLVWVGTRWSIADPIGRRLNLLETNDAFSGYRYRVVNYPALDEHDESNFHYKYGVGFTTEEYQRRRASFEANDDMASWLAQYMGEPIEREGTLFASGDLRYYNGVLPDEQPVRIFMACDPAWGGGDYVSAPVAYKYENGDIYIHDVVFDNGEKTVTEPKIVDAVIRNHVAALQVEATKMTSGYADDIEALLKKKGEKINLTTRPAPTSGQSKESRIFDKAPDIRQRFVFRDVGHRSREYNLFMQNLFSFKFLGKNKHDDAPDSLAMLVGMDTMVTYKATMMKPMW